MNEVDRKDADYRDVAIQTRDVYKTFREGWLLRPVRALDGLSFTVYEGDIFGLLGPNGAGKSTALHCLLGLLNPDSGSVSVLGQTPEPGNGIFEEIVYLPEEPDYHENLKVGEALSHYTSLYNQSPSRAEIESALRDVELWGVRNRKIKHCSKGMKQRFGLATCFVRSPRLVLLDEPTRGLDPLMVRHLRDYLRQLNEQGTTVFLNSHVFSEIEMICNRAAVMDEGRCLVQESLEELRQVDPDTYHVEMEPIDRPPEYLDVLGEHANRLTARCPREKLGDLVQHCEEKGHVLYECSLRQLKLEDVFEDILEGDYQQ